jgi:hypothetical protein
LLIFPAGCVAGFLERSARMARTLASGVSALEIVASMAIGKDFLKIGIPELVFWYLII